MIYPKVNVKSMNNIQTALEMEFLSLERTYIQVRIDKTKDTIINHLNAIMRVKYNVAIITSSSKMNRRIIPVFMMPKRLFSVLILITLFPLFLFISGLFTCFIFLVLTPF